MLKKFLILMLVMLGFVALPNFTYAQKATPAPSSSPIASPVSSFEIFWPVTAGKTMDDSLYFVKTLKENIRGFLIFGTPQKADYQVSLATKRLVEAEKLIKDGKNDAALKTIDKFNGNIDSAKELWTSAKNASDIPSNTKDNVSKQLGNLQSFMKWYITTVSGEAKTKLESILAKVESLDRSL